MEEAKTMFEDIEKDECNKAVIESGDCIVDINKDDKVTTTEATDVKEPESLTTTSDLGKDISVLKCLIYLFFSYIRESRSFCGLLYLNYKYL